METIGRQLPSASMNSLKLLAVLNGIAVGHIATTVAIEVTCDWVVAPFVGTTTRSRTTAFSSSSTTTAPKTTHRHVSLDMRTR